MASLVALATAMAPAGRRPIGRADGTTVAVAWTAAGMRDGLREDRIRNPVPLTGVKAGDTMRAAAGRPRLTVRLARDLGLDGNPLHRASDRAEAWIRAGLVVVFLIGAPMAAVAVGLWTADAAGSGTSARSAPAGPAVLAGIMALAAAALALLIVLRLIRRLLDWRRLAAWEAAWRAIGPRWTGRKSS
jgi:hypothetical protein